MAIEPLSSAMTYQAQNTQQARPVHKTAENTDVSTTVEQTVNFDPTTAKIKEVDEKNGQGTETNNQGTPEQQTPTNEQIKKQPPSQQLLYPFLSVSAPSPVLLSWLLLLSA